MHVLVVNDDGIRAGGLRALALGFLACGHRVTVCAPDRERSCAGHALSLREPLYAERVRDFPDGVDAFEVSGTPADCARLGLSNLAGAPVDLVASGINHGSNLGTDTLYSGTVSAALEAVLMGYPALSVSLISTGLDDFSAAVACATTLADWMAEHDFPRGRVFNLNVPPRPLNQILGIHPAPLSYRAYVGDYVKRVAPGGRIYYWSDNRLDKAQIAPSTDTRLIEQGYATLTPLGWDLTDTGALDALTPITLKGAREHGLL